MLEPSQRANLFELLRPPVGYQLEAAVGTTFSLDLMSALLLPLSFTRFDWEKPDGELLADPSSLLESLREYAGKMTIFCQEGMIRLPGKYHKLLVFLENCIFESRAPKPDGAFHPKVWVLRFVGKKGEVLYRVLVLSRNLTSDRSWDTALVLVGALVDGETAANASSVEPLAQLLEGLPRMASAARRRLPADRRRSILQMAAEIRKVRFLWPEGFEAENCRFWVAGLVGSAVAEPFGSKRDQCLIVSPFLSEEVVQPFAVKTPTILVSRHEEFAKLSSETRLACKSLHMFAPELSAPAQEEDELTPAAGEDLLEGLHAKLFVIDRGWRTSIFTGSFNATVHAFAHNVELMVELVGLKSRFGIDQLLAGNADGFAKLLVKVDPETIGAADSTTQLLDDLVMKTRRAILKAEPELRVEEIAGTNQYLVRLAWGSLKMPTGASGLAARPISLPVAAEQALDAQGIRFELPLGLLTPLFQFSFTATVGGKSQGCCFVSNLPCDWFPEDRVDFLLRELLADREKLMRHILFMLIMSTDADENGGEGITVGWGAQGAELNFANQTLLELLLRNLHRNPRQLARVQSLLQSLRNQGADENGPPLIDPEFDKIWNPVWEIAQKLNT
jgi:hypothetical protein